MHDNHVPIARRWLLKPLIVLVVMVAAILGEIDPASGQDAPDDRPAELTHGPLLGAVSDTSVKVWVRADRPTLFQVEIVPRDEPWSRRIVGDIHIVAVRDHTGVVDVAGLIPATHYEYRIILDGRPLDASGAFRTLSPAGKAGAFRLALGGDLYEKYMPFTILDRLKDTRPDFTILLGDLIYSDHPFAIPPSTEAYRSKYQTNWSDPSFRALTRDIPTFMMWDDHEIVNDYDGAEPGRYVAARAALDEYVTNTIPPSRRAGALYYTFQVADVDFFVLDTRTHRHRNSTKDDGGKSMLGAAQKADLKEWLAESRAPFKVVLSSVPFHNLGVRRADSWNGFAVERDELLNLFAQRGGEDVVLLSGDQHWASLVRHDPRGVWEFNATPLAHAVQSGSFGNDPRLTIAYNESPVFGLVDVDTRGPLPKMTFTVVDGAGQVRGSRTIESARQP